MPVLLRLKSALLTWPKADEWAVSLAIFCGAAVAMAAVAFPFELVHWQPRIDAWLLRLSVFAVPAFPEELVFRGLLIPGRSKGQHAVRWIAFSTLAFVLWHVIEAATILPGAGLFLHPAFLSCAGILGLACAVTRHRTDSLWPAVLFHGFVVLVWQVLLGGPTVAELLH